MARRFEGKTALVTGGSRGIGKAIVEALVKEGANVYALGKSQENLDRLKRDISSVNIVQTDVTDWEKTKTAVADIGVVDLLINNAGFLEPLTNFVDVHKNHLDDVINTNFSAAFNISQIVTRRLISTGRPGAIVNMSSINAKRPADHRAACYCMSKAMIDMLTKTMALELGHHQIRVNSINPTIVVTDMTKEALKNEEFVRPFLEKHPLGKFAELQDVVDAVLFVLSDEASMITGSNIPVDGGYLGEKSKKLYPMSMTSLKTRDLTWQDHTLNIEVMLAPSRSMLLWNKHKSLSSHCSKDKKKFERQFENVVKNFKSEKILIDRRRAELYTKRTLVFLEKLPPEIRSEVLSRKSFSISLSRIANDLNDNANSRLSAPSTRHENRQKSRESGVSSAKSEQQPRRQSSLPLLPSNQRKPSTTEIVSLNTERKQSRVQHYSVNAESPRQNNIFQSPINSPRNYLTPTNQHLPVISTGSTQEMDHKRTSRSPSVANSHDEENGNEDYQDKPYGKSVRFKNMQKELITGRLQEKIKGFLAEQNKFNTDNPISGRSDLARRAAQVEDSPDSNKLMNAFDNFCKSKSKSKIKLHNLVKLASRIKDASRSSQEIPSICVENLSTTTFGRSRQSISAS